MPADKIKYKISNTYTSLLDLIYPVGALYISSVNTSPANLFGGTWAQITDGAALRAATTYGLTGSDTCKLTSSQIPNHVHNLWYKIGWGSGGGGSTGYYTYSTFTSVGNAWDATTDAYGGGGAHSIVQRSLNCYVWRRTA